MTPDWLSTEPAAIGAASGSVFGIHHAFAFRVVGNEWRHWRTIGFDGHRTRYAGGGNVMDRVGLVRCEAGHGEVQSWLAVLRHVGALDHGALAPLAGDSGAE